MLNPSYSILGIQILEENSVDLEEVAHYEPPHQDLRCLQIQLFSSLVLKELKLVENMHSSAIIEQFMNDLNILNSKFRLSKIDLKVDKKILRN